MEQERMVDGRIDIYKWLKVAQFVIIILMGVMFVVTGILNKEEEISQMILSISMGAVLAIYGVLDIVASYLLYHSVVHKDVIVGEVILAFAVVLFIQHDLVLQVMAYFFIVFFFAFASMLVLHGFDLIFGKHVKKSIPGAISYFIFAGLLVGSDVFAIVYYSIDKADVEKYMLIIVGALLVLFGISSLVVTLKKVRETKIALMENKAKQQQDEQKAEEKKEVRVINIEDLKKNNTKNKKSVSDETEVKKISN